MKLADIVNRVVIDPHKLTDYAPDSNNPVGRHKALIFERHLGFTRHNYESLLQLVDLPEQGVHQGAVGAIVHCYPDNTYEVEFTNEDGETLALCTLSPAQFIVVWRAKTKKWVPTAERIAALMSDLPEEKEVKE